MKIEHVFFSAANGARGDEAANEDERGVRRGARPRGSTRSVANVAAGTGAGASSVSFVKQFILPIQRQKNSLRYRARLFSLTFEKNFRAKNLRRPKSASPQSKTTVLPSCTSTLLSRWYRSALASATRSTSFPLRTMSFTVSRCETGATSCTMMGPMSNLAVA